MKIRHRSLVFLGLFFILFGTFVLSVSAVHQGTEHPPVPGTEPPGIITLQNPFKHGDNLYDFIVAVIKNIILPVGGVIAVMAFIYSGFLFVTAQGNEEKLKTAKKAFLYTVIGTVILLGAWVIALLIETTINQLTS
ncbi:hypothetical protein EPN83_00295 [Patescibacteria group bacterium]|nr:MAG: hypothetical protein EPN83_00295 [Patescibacteria group bacterium]